MPWERSQEIRVSRASSGTSRFGVHGANDDVNGASSRSLTGSSAGTSQVSTRELGWVNASRHSLAPNPAQVGEVGFELGGARREPLALGARPGQRHRAPAGWPPVMHAQSRQVSRPVLDRHVPSRDRRELQGDPHRRVRRRVGGGRRVGAAVLVDIGRRAEEGLAPDRHLLVAEQHRGAGAGRARDEQRDHLAGDRLRTPPDQAHPVTGWVSRPARGAERLAREQRPRRGDETDGDRVSGFERPATREGRGDLGDVRAGVRKDNLVHEQGIAAAQAAIDRGRLPLRLDNRHVIGLRHIVDGEAAVLVGDGPARPDGHQSPRQGLQAPVIDHAAHDRGPFRPGRGRGRRR